MNASVLRVLDANANRAREALRVIEDYVRFVLDDGELSELLKMLRHDLTAATRWFLDDAIVFRDTPGDVGTTNKMAAELAREDMADVVIAAGKRLGEALRTIEEFSKTINREGAAAVEAIRYRFYEVERRLALRLRPARAFEDVRLYVLITEELCSGPWLATAEAALLGGADCLQLREKELESGELLERARQLVQLCRRHDAICIINDRADIALLSGADGVHLGQTDLPARAARRILGAGKIIGVSTQNSEQAQRAQADGADYIGVGPIFRSTTKPRESVSGLAYARQIAQTMSMLAVAIAGINAENVDEVLACGIKAIAVCSAVISAADVRGAARQLKQRLGATNESQLSESQRVALK